MKLTSKPVRLLIVGTWVATIFTAAAIIQRFLVVLKARPEYLGSIGHFFGTLSLYDASNFMTIAQRGYPYDTIALRAFFPFFPMIIHAMALIIDLIARSPVDLILAATILNVVALGVALTILGRLMRMDDYDDAGVGRAQLWLLAYPFAFFLLAPYTESLFLALSLGSIYAARRGRWLAACLLAMAASGTRMPGLILGPVLLVELLHQRGWSIKKCFPTALYLLLAPLGAAAYFVFLALNGSIGSYFQAYSIGWPNRHPGLNILAPIYSPVVDLITHRIIHLNVILGLAGVALLIVTGVWGRTRLRPSYLLLVLLSISLPLLSGSVESFGRYAMVVFPVYIMAAMIIERRRNFWLAIGASFCLQLALLMLFVRGVFVG